MMLKEEPIDFHFDLRHLLAWRPPKLRFDDIEEAHFRASCAEARLNHFIVSGAIALMAFLLFLLADQRMIPDVYELAFKVRVYWYSSAAMVLFSVAIFFRRFVLLLPWAFLEFILTMTGVMAAASLGWLLTHSHSPHAGLYTAGLVPIVVYGNLVQRFRFKFAFAFSYIVIGISIACAASRYGKGLPFDMFDMPLVLLVTLLAHYTLVMNYRLELEERRRFQWAVRASDLHKKLSASRAQLDLMSRRDPLTGVPNRRHFDEYVREQWDLQAEQGGQMALLLMDVDHFKAFNDRYGHPAGDQCLRHVAEILQKAVPAQQGCVARWGGEEFIVALPGMNAEQAQVVGLSLCHAVLSSGLRHEGSDTAPSVTISIGAAAACPGRGGVTVDGLVAQADAALYRAKREGRNRCVRFEPEAVPA
ncbi:MAG: GGDEF domain-containing protein [Aquabacterium sp.]